MLTKGIYVFLSLGNKFDFTTFCIESANKLDFSLSESLLLPSLTIAIPGKKISAGIFNSSCKSGGSMIEKY